MKKRVAITMWAALLTILMLLAACGPAAVSYTHLDVYKRQLVRLLHDRGHLPANPTDFLNYAAERNLLRKVGGGYTFVHALLLEYFNERT